MMRDQIRQSMSNVGCKRFKAVATVQLALETLRKEQFDLILCDYNLGENTNGQQFLEYIRTRDLISRNTLFTMITGEQTYQKVMIVAECAPDDYLLKPFTPTQLNARIDRLVDRQEVLQGIDRASDMKRWDLVIAECDRLLASRSKYVFDALKIKGTALLKSDRAKDARRHYEQVLQQKPLGWAKVGLAKAMEAEGDIDDACALLQEIIAESPLVMQAYDLLAKVLANSDRQEQAMEVLQAAGEISPGTMSRLRTLSTLAIGLGRHEVAEQVMSNALKINKHSPLRNAGDYALLSRALSSQKKSEAALDALRLAQKSFNDAASKIMLTATECIVYQQSGDHTKAAEALTKASAADLTGISSEITMSVAEAMIAMGRDKDAYSLIKQAIQNNPTDNALMQKVKAVLGSAGNSQLAEEIIASSRREIIQLNNEGVRQAGAGELDEAVALLSAAADRLPNNLQIVGNAALALARHMARHGVESDRMSTCLRYRNSLALQSSQDPKLKQIDTLLEKLNR